MKGCDGDRVARHCGIWLALLWVVLLGGAPVAAAEKHYSWDAFSFSYPDSWQITVDELDGTSRQLKISPTQGEIPALLLTLAAVFPPRDPEYWKMPVLFSVAYGLGLALELAGPAGDDAVLITYGTIGTSQGPVMSARFLVLNPEDNSFHSLESFHLAAGGRAVMGVILDSGQRGRVNDDLHYARQLEELQRIIAGLEIRD